MRFTVRCFVKVFAFSSEQFTVAPCTLIFVCVFQKPQRNYRANSYVIPSDKKRKTLRWQIRADLAHGVKPPSVFD